MQTETRAKIARPPVVVVMGHVDHGKTTLLDYIRKTTVAAREAGGITQAVGAYEIEHSVAHSTDAHGAPSVRKITFIDTPGHEAFSKMRSAGAHIADLAILVVAADDGVKPQTKEAISILQETKTPFIVALNKLDKKEADVERAKGDLAANGVLLEGYGGQVSYHAISSKTGEGVSDLLDLILLAADVEHLTYDAGASASGFILEARMDRRRGIEVTGILTDGALREGDAIATASASGKVKILENFLGKRVAELAPSSPAIIIGFATLPRVGESFSTGKINAASATGATAAKPPGEPRAATPQDTGGKKFILKASDLGSLEALSVIMRNLPSEIPPAVFAESVGDVTDGDVKMAQATDASIIGFKVKATQPARNLAEANRVPIILSNIIYELVKKVEELLAGAAIPDALGMLEVLAVFNKEKLSKQVVGGRVTHGSFRNKSPFEIERAGVVVGKGRVTNLQQEKKDTASVPEGKEAGLMVECSIAIEKGDILVVRK
ncbi:MAG: GTP-binding protein [Candidatus Liptonbacteria bacterium]|nr:GTP-binding protein [Candidatus Liptonbacteria bacterium]